MSAPGVRAGSVIRIASAVATCLMLEACVTERTDAPDDGPIREQSPIRVLREMAVAFNDSSDEFLFHPTDLALAGDTLIVVDNGNDRIVFVDTALAFLGFVGREGEGPGEFASPVSVQVTPREIVIAEINNGRFTVLDRSGAFVRTFGHTIPASSFAIDSKGVVYQSGRSVTHHALKISSDGEMLHAVRRDTATGEEAAAILKTTRESWLAISGADTLHVFNDTDGTLSKYAPDGTRVVTRELPATYLDSLKAKRLRLVTALSRYGVTEYSGSLIGDFSTTDENQLLIKGWIGNTIGLVIDPVTYIARRIVVDAMTGEWVPLRDATGIAMRGNRLYAVSMDQLYVYELDLGEER